MSKYPSTNKDFCDLDVCVLYIENFPTLVIVMFKILKLDWLIDW